MKKAKKTENNNDNTENFYEVMYYLQPLIDNIIENFNFDKLQLAMQALDWEMALVREGEKCFAIPTSKELIALARRLLNEVIEYAWKEKRNETYHIETGPFIVNMSVGNVFKSANLRLIASIEDWSEETKEWQNECEALNAN